MSPSTLRRSLLVALTLAAALSACERDRPAEPTPAASSPPPAATPAPMASEQPTASAAPTLAAPATSQQGQIPAPADVAAPPADAKKTPSGLATKVLTPGTGKTHPNPNDTVVVDYTGWTTDGRMFDSSVPRGEPTSFRVNQVIKGWTEGLQLMVQGEKRRFWIPAALAYGDHAPPGAPSGNLTFDVDLKSIKEAPKPPSVPPDVAAPPASAKKTASGLAYRLLKKGSGNIQPKEHDRVVVNYSGWTTDGKMFDSSVTRGEPAHFRLDGVIKGWTEGVQLMKVGDSMRFWIPAKLAYGENPRPGAPAGMLVFDIDLLAIE